MALSSLKIVASKTSWPKMGFCWVFVEIPSQNLIYLEMAFQLEKICCLLSLQHISGNPESSCWCIFKDLSFLLGWHLYQLQVKLVRRCLQDFLQDSNKRDSLWTVWNHHYTAGKIMNLTQYLQILLFLCRCMETDKCYEMKIT